MANLFLLTSDRSTQPSLQRWGRCSPSSPPLNSQVTPQHPLKNQGLGQAFDSVVETRLGPLHPYQSAWVQVPFQSFSTTSVCSPFCLLLLPPWEAAGDDSSTHLGGRIDFPAPDFDLAQPPPTLCAFREPISRGKISVPLYLPFFNNKARGPRRGLT